MTATYWYRIAHNCLTQQPAANQLLPAKAGMLVTMVIIGFTVTDKFRIILEQELGVPIINNIPMPVRDYHRIYDSLVPQFVKLFLKKKHRGRYLYLCAKIQETMLEYSCYTGALTNRKKCLYKNIC